MQIVINIPEEIYERFGHEYREENLISKHINDIILDAFCNGTPLPKGHGRILDEKDILDTENNDGGWYDLVDMPEYIAGVKAIIEADKAD